MARCTSCGRHYCRECVAEHDNRMICGACLRRGVPAARTGGRAWFAALGRFAQTLAAIFVAWAVFYSFGRWLLRNTDSMHENTQWQGGWWEEKKP